MAYRPPERLHPFLDALPRRLYAHIARVVAEAERLAAIHGHDVARARAAAWAHDVARAMTGDELMRRAAEYGLEVGDAERSAPVLLHGPVGAEMLRREGGWGDEQILDAVRYHTTGRQGMSAFEMVVLLADKIEPAKVSSEELRRVRAASLGDLAAGAKLFYAWHRAKNDRLGRPTHPRALEASVWLAGVTRPSA